MTLKTPNDGTGHCPTCGQPVTLSDTLRKALEIENPRGALETDWHAEADRLRAGIEAFLNGDAETMPRAITYRADGAPSKHDQCPHGQYMWEGCEECADAYFQRLLAKPD